METYNCCVLSSSLHPRNVRCWMGWEGRQNAALAKWKGLRLKPCRSLAPKAASFAGMKSKFGRELKYPAYTPFIEFLRLSNPKNTTLLVRLRLSLLPPRIDPPYPSASAKVQS